MITIIKLTEIGKLNLLGKEKKIISHGLAV